MLLELCTGSIDDCLTAAANGADRLELNSALQLGGLTPSLGTLQEVVRLVELPVIAMVRPRPGGFNYAPSELTVMQRDADLMVAHGARGLAFGFLHDDGRVDGARCRAFMAHAGAGEFVFHRAFDLTPDPARALEKLIDLGVTRVLTSGQEASAYNGAARIARLREQAAGRIELLPAGGINRFTVADVLVRTGCDQVHASLSTLRPDASGGVRPAVSFNAPRLYDDRFPATDAAAVGQMRALLDSWKEAIR